MSRFILINGVSESMPEPWGGIFDMEKDFSNCGQHTQDTAQVLCDAIERAIVDKFTITFVGAVGSAVISEEYDLPIEHYEKFPFDGVIEREVVIFAE